MLPDDLGRRIALDALGAGIPAGDDAVRVQHEERIVGDAVDEQPELTLAFAQTILGLAPLGNIASDLRKADQIAAGIVNGVEHDRRPEARAVLANAPAFGFVICPRALRSPVRVPAARRRDPPGCKTG